MSLVDVFLLEPMYATDEEQLLIRKGATFASGSPVYLREPIASEYIAGYLQYRGVSTEVMQQTTEKDSEIIDIIKNKSPRILGVSIHSSHIVNRVLEFLTECKKNFPELTIVCGGAHPTGAPELVRENSIDYVVIGEGEETMYELTLATSGKSGTENIKGLAYKKNHQVMVNPPRGRFDFSQQFWPLRRREILDRIKSAPLSYPPPPEQKGVAQVSYSRGCPYKCFFCVSPMVFPGKVIFRDPEDVINEIKFLQKEFHTNFVFFTDLTFNHFPDKVHSLCDSMIAGKLDINWFAYCSVHVQRDVIEKMAQAGCTRIGIGAESLIDKVLEDIKPQQRLSDIRRALELTDTYGILNRTYLMIGNPEETIDDLERLSEIIKTLPMDQPRVAFTTPFPGTQLYNEVQGRLTTTELEKFTGDYPVIRNENISVKEYMDWRDRIVREFYGSVEYGNHVRDKCEKHPHLAGSFRYFFRYLLEKNLIEETAYARLTNSSALSDRTA